MLHTASTVLLWSFLLVQYFFVASLCTPTILPLLPVTVPATSPTTQFHSTIPSNTISRSMASRSTFEFKSFGFPANWVQYGGSTENVKAVEVVIAQSGDSPITATEGEWCLAPAMRAAETVGTNAISLYQFGATGTTNLSLTFTNAKCDPAAASKLTPITANCSVLGLVTAWWIDPSNITAGILYSFVWDPAVQKHRMYQHTTAPTSTKMLATITGLSSTEDYKDATALCEPNAVIISEASGKFYKLNTNTSHATRLNSTELAARSSLFGSSAIFAGIVTDCNDGGIYQCTG
ncbi:hypothetical protein Pelo_14124 [Pelomyxa schiedti]|nr:hypothetical protein Pelo_14124 [Pelomyxa schiedti]